MLSEPWPALTDLALGVVAAVLARRVGAEPGVGRHWRTMLRWAAVAALAGAFHHAVVTHWERWTGPSWALISAMVVLTISYALAASVDDVLGPGRRAVFWVLRTGSLLAYGVLALLGHYGIATIVACEGVTMACVVGLWVLALVHRRIGARGMVVALATNIVAGISRALPSGLTELVGLDPVSVYHLAQIPPMVLLYLAVVDRARRLDGADDAGRHGAAPSANVDRTSVGRTLEQRDD